MLEPHFLAVIQLIISLIIFQSYQFTLKFSRRFIIIVGKSSGGEATATFIFHSLFLPDNSGFVN